MFKLIDKSNGDTIGLASTTDSLVEMIREINPKLIISYLEHGIEAAEDLGAVKGDPKWFGVLETRYIIQSVYS